MNDDSEYRRYLMACAKTCLCCPECQQVPCDGCQQGGECDGWHCTCDAYGYDYDKDEDWGDDDEEVTR